MNRSVRPLIVAAVVAVTSLICFGARTLTADDVFGPSIIPQNFDSPTDPFLHQDSLSCEPAGAEAWRWQILPEGLMYTSYLAGEKEPRLSNSFLFETHGPTLWDTTLGWRVGLLRFGTKRAIQPEGFQLDVEGGTFLRALAGGDHDLQSMDFRAGLPLTWREGPFQVKAAVYHVESHVGDDFLTQNPGFVPNGYSRTALVGGLGYFVFDSLRLYSEVGWSFARSGGDRPWEWQSGLEWNSPNATGLRGAPYFAANVHLREATHGSGSFNMMAGWQWRRTQSDHLFRVGLQYFNGKNNQYSFLQDTQQLFGFGVRYDY